MEIERKRKRNERTKRRLVTYRTERTERRRKSALYSLTSGPKKKYHKLEADFGLSLPLRCDTDS
jgi:hypothetical protein